MDGRAGVDEQEEEGKEREGKKRMNGGRMRKKERGRRKQEIVGLVKEKEHD